jgi:CHAT domain-containing protein/tetratricopeptide (TPR) repeat protein
MLQHEVASLNHTVKGLFERGLYVDALEPAHRAVELSSTHLGPDHPQTLTSLNNLAMLYGIQGRYEEAEPLFRRALAGTERSLGKDHPDTLITVNNLVMLYQNQGRQEEAEPLLARALAGAERTLGPDHPGTLLSVHNLAGLFMRQGRYGEAEALYKRALTARQLVLGGHHSDTLSSAHNLAALYERQGRFPEAQPLLAQVVAMAERTLGPDHPYTLHAVNSLAMVCQRQGRYEESEPLLLKSFAGCMRVLGPNHPQTLTSANNLATWYEIQGRYAEAESFYEHSMAGRGRVLGPDHPDTLNSVNNLAVFLAKQGRHVEAAPLLARARAGRENVLGPDHPDSLSSIHNLAASYASRAHHAEAELLYEQVLARRERVLGPDHPDTLASMTNLGLLRASRGDAEQAFELLERSTRSETRLLVHRLSISSATQAAITVQQAESLLHAFISLVWRDLQSSVRHVRIAADMVFRRKAIGLEAAASQRAALWSCRYPHLEAQIRELTGLRMQIAYKTMVGISHGESPERHRQTLKDWNGRVEWLESELMRQIPDLGLGERLSRVDRNAVALTLSEGATLIEFLRFNVFDFLESVGEKQWKQARYVAFVLRAGQGDAVRMVDLGEAEPIDSMVRRFRSCAGPETGARKMPAVQSPAAESWWQVAERLHAAVLDKVLVPQSAEQGAASSSETNRLFLATDGELNLLPFEALRTPRGRFLTDEYEISYLGTSRDLLRGEEGKELAVGEPVVAADPAFLLGGAGHSDVSTSSGFRGEMKREGIGFPRLPGTRLEGERIGRRLGVTPWMADQVLEGKLKRLCSPRVLHTATHGYFLSDQKAPRDDWNLSLGVSAELGAPLSGAGLTNPMLRSGLALAGSQNWLERKPVPEEAEDGLLTAEDVAAMDLRGTEMAVLSACDTGLGEVRHGEGVFGLRRGFLLAGVKTLVMSLWKVDDLAAVLLMDRFYENLLERGMGRSEALREAQRYLRREVTVGGIRAEWLNEEMISKLAGGNPKVRERLEQWRDSPDDVRPFREVFYWAPFILHGETGPLELKKVLRDR